MSDIVLDPALWESIEAGAQAYVEQWLVSEGDHVRAGQVLGRARLLQAVVDVVSAHPGVVEEIFVAVGDAFVPGKVLARVIAT